MTMSFGKKFQRVLEANYYTPDMPDIYRKESHFVFVGNNMMLGKARARCMYEHEDTHYLGKAFTKHATYGIMIYESKVEPPNPLFFEVVQNKESAFIHGDLFEVSSELIPELDYYQSNMLYNKRKLIPVVTSSSQLEAMAWTWIADHSYFNASTFLSSKLIPYTKREFLWNVPAIAWDHSIWS